MRPKSLLAIGLLMACTQLPIALADTGQKPAAADAAKAQEKAPEKAAANSAKENSVALDKPAPKGVEIDVKPLASDTDDDIPKAKSIDLDKPVPPEEAPAAIVQKNKVAPEKVVPEPEVVDRTQSAEQTDNTDTLGIGDEPEEVGVPFVMLSTEVPSATATRLAWSPSQSFEGIANATPVLVVNGKKPGPVLCLTAALHGDELNGIEIVRRVLYNIDPEKLSGAVVGVPIVNLQGFRRSSRYLPDRRDLNRFFPGNPDGSSASRIAHSFFNEVINKCSALVDLHTGSFDRTNLPQLRANLHNPLVLELSQGFGATVVLHSDGAVGTLRRAAVEAGIPAVTLEAGGPMRLQEKEVAHGVKAIQTLLNKLDMVKKSSFWGDPEPVFYESVWVRADRGGILFSEVFLGKRVKKGDHLGTVTDPITNHRNIISAPHSGRVLGMALNQFVMPGFAAYRIGLERDEKEISKPQDGESDTSQDTASEAVDSEDQSKRLNGAGSKTTKVVATSPATELAPSSEQEDSE